MAWRRSNPSPVSIGRTLRRALPEGGEEKLALSGIRSAWESIAGPTLGGKSFPEDLEKGVLCVIAQSAPAAKAISMRSASIARAAASQAGIPVASLKVRVGKVPGIRHQAGSSSSGMKLSPPREDVERNFEAVKHKFPPGREDLARRFASLMALFQKRFGGRGRQDHP